jgi:hypothetical protein
VCGSTSAAELGVPSPAQGRCFSFPILRPPRRIDASWTPGLTCSQDGDVLVTWDRDVGGVQLLGLAATGRGRCVGTLTTDLASCEMISSSGRSLHWPDWPHCRLVIGAKIKRAREVAGIHLVQTPQGRRADHFYGVGNSSGVNALLLDTER